MDNAKGSEKSVMVALEFTFAVTLLMWALGFQVVYVGLLDNGGLISDN